MRISQLAQETGVSPHRLRRWESAGLLHAERSPAGYRDYPTASVREATFVSMGRDMGFSLSELASVLPRYRAGTLTADEVIRQVLARIDAVDELISEQQALKDRLVSHVAWLEDRRGSR